MISLILLCGGLSTRFGSPKALAPWGQEVVISHLQDMLVFSNLDEIIVVLGANADKIQPFLLKHNKIKVVYNKDYKMGQTSSFKAGVRNVGPSVQAVGLLPVDLPLIKIETVNILVREFLEKKPLILVPTFHGQKGHPPIFNISLCDEILNLPDDAGLNTISHRYKQDTHYCETDDEGCVLSFNTPQELEIINKKII